MRPHLKAKFAAQAGFTLVEIMVVVVILGLLATAATIGVTRNLLDAKNGLAKTGCATLESAIKSYVLMKGDVDADEILERCLEDRRLEHKDDLEDPWGELYYVEKKDGEGYHVFSKGADKERGSDDDNGRHGIVSESEESDW